MPSPPHPSSAKYAVLGEPSKGASEPLLATDLSEERNQPLNSSRACVLVCLFTFLLAFKPSQPHMAQYLRQVKGFSQADIVHYIFPIAAYAQFVLVVLQGYICEFLGYKYAIIMGAGGRVCTRMCMLYGTEIWHFQLSEICYSMGSAMLIIFGGYIFNLVTRENYQRIIAVQQMATLGGHVSAGYVGDILINAFNCDLTVLMYISAVSITSGFLLAFSFPQVSYTKAPSLTKVFRSVKRIYSCPVFLLMLTLWCVLTSVHSLVWGYETSLYDYLKVEQHYVGDYNGILASSGLLLGALSAMLSNNNWVLDQHVSHPHRSMIIEGAIISVCILLMSRPSLTSLSIGFILYFGAYTIMNTSFIGHCGRFAGPPSSETVEGISSSGSAEKSSGTPERGHFAALFTANFLLSQSLQTLLTWIVYSDLKLNVRQACLCMSIYIGTSTLLATGAAMLMYTNGITRVWNRSILSQICHPTTLRVFLNNKYQTFH
ncbi:hypothetical protein FOZ62_014257 [Perkinsus olseni]|uniref:Uncharacterized protein n=2 Tax=Perkinsus olseni TaxID=32597 RepID=A0A7J6QAJ2_PEROL|nr:hypothetical protein FOZ62_014257 [Perkinsus olseni]